MQCLNTIHNDDVEMTEIFIRYNKSEKKRNLNYTRIVFLDKKKQNKTK